MTERRVFSDRCVAFTSDGVAEDGSATFRQMKAYPDGIRVFWSSGQPTRVYRAIPGTERDVDDGGLFPKRVREYEEIDPASENAPAWVRERFGKLND